jgi:hypothetical protein
MGVIAILITGPERQKKKTSTGTVQGHMKYLNLAVRNLPRVRVTESSKRKWLT